MFAVYHDFMKYANGRPTRLLVFDLETVPDLELARAMNSEWAELEDISVRAKLSAAALEKSGGRSDFLTHPYHKIVAIGALMVDMAELDGQESYTLKSLRCIGSEEDSEKVLLEKFGDFCGRAFEGGQPFRLVSYNGRGFDVPVVKVRALKHGVPLPWLFMAGDKWSNYGSRYDVTWHMDLADAMTDFGAARAMVKLDEACALVGAPGKLDLDGSWVADLDAAGELGKVRDYCETDVLNTYILYLHWQHLVGMLAAESLKRELSHVMDYLVAEGEERTHLADFAAAWEIRG